MAFFAEKVRRQVSSKFTFLFMTDRNDLDTQIFGTFVGCGVADEQTPRASNGDDLRKILKENHRFVFSLIHKFNQDVDPSEPYSTRDDIIVVSDEAHRTQAGKLARNMRLALPNASFIGFTGTPLFKHDSLTTRIFGSYVSRYDFKRSEEDGATVKLVYENRGEKLGIARLDLNDRIADAIARATLDPDQERSWNVCWARTTRSLRLTTGWTRSPLTSWSIAQLAGNPASQCWSALIKSRAQECINESFLAGKRSWLRPSHNCEFGTRTSI
ncbi:MAG: DEAD/DEAH box helicase family protein [Pirellulaceae bacterium]